MCYGFCMKNILHFYVSKGDTQYVAECVELAIVTQGATLDELTKNIREATNLHLESLRTEKNSSVTSPLLSINFEFA